MKNFNAKCKGENWRRVGDEKGRRDGVEGKGGRWERGRGERGKEKGGLAKRGK